MIREAIISNCGLYRYRLTRHWGQGKALAFIMLNPSTADANIDDATIRKCIGFAKVNGFNAIDVVNLFAYRATKPSDLKTAGYPVGDLNDLHISDCITEAGKVVLAWGMNAHGHARVDDVFALIKAKKIRPYFLKLSTSGVPSHPLMLSYKCQLHEVTLV
jgi:hypothetical protein